MLNTVAFALNAPINVADAASATELADVVAAQLTFFDWMENPTAVMGDVRRRYVPGLLEPALIAPYLRAHLGADAVQDYAQALLDGRPELAPAFASELAAPIETPSNLDHGTQLARAVVDFADGRRPSVPTDTVASSLSTARHLRCFFGRQLRAWGEAERAHALRRIGDDEIHALRAQQLTLGRSAADKRAAARLVLRATGADRDPARTEPTPRLFQYHALHVEPFAPEG